MQQTTFLRRPAAAIENDILRVTVTETGGHIAEILHKPTGVSPLWVPPWSALERPNCGSGAEARLLAGILGHNVCLDVFGGPSGEEAAAGIGVHGEAAVLPYELAADGAGMRARVEMPLAGMRFERRIALAGDAVTIHETVENLNATDRPIAWTQHVTLGPPFLVKGATEFRASATRSKVFEGAPTITCRRGRNSSGRWRRGWICACSAARRLPAGSPRI
jgi:hypothetical protein